MESLELKNPVVWKNAQKYLHGHWCNPLSPLQQVIFMSWVVLMLPHDSLMAEVSQAVWMYAPGTAKWTKVADYQTDINQYLLSGERQ